MAGMRRKIENTERDALSVAPDGLSQIHAQLLRLTGEHLRDREAWSEERRHLLDEKTWLRAMIDQVPDYLFVKDLE